MNVAIIGAGAAGCFCAIHLKRLSPSVNVTLFEANRSPLAKVAVTGGGRCNLTNTFAEVGRLAAVYPRGERLMKRVLSVFDHADLCRWFEAEGVALTVQEDQCVFPASQDAGEIVRTLTRLLRRHDIPVRCGHRVVRIEALEPIGFRIHFGSGMPFDADAVVVTTGGSPKPGGLTMLDGLGLEIVPPVPSLFALNVADEALRKRTGLVVQNTLVKLAGTRFQGSGPLLVTHFGFSGPAIIKLSSYAARHLAEHAYGGRLAVNWFGDADEAEVRARLFEQAGEHPRKTVLAAGPEEIPARLWEYLIAKAGLKPGVRWGETGTKNLNRLACLLIHDEYEIRGKYRHKAEFVTCGGVALSNVSLNTLECRAHPGLYFAGEVLDVDGITGGFNLQAAWSMGYVAASALASRIENPSGSRVLPSVTVD